MKILIIKLSSLGDLLHTFPALTDLHQADPSLEVTWMVESAFKEVPLWHPAVKHVIEAPLRQIKKEKLGLKIKKIRQLIKMLRKQKYDLIIDAQGLFKSALLAKLAKGSSIGFAKGSCREPVWWLYHQPVPADKGLHAIERIRTLFSAIGISKKGDINYSLQQWKKVENKILFFAHGTTWDSKHYPDVLWKNIVKLATHAGYTVWLPHANEKELARAESLRINKNVEILPKMSLTGIQEKLYGVAGMVSVDSGLAHIAAAMGVPNVTLYGPTAPAKIGTMGQNQIHLTSQIFCAPCEKRTCFHEDRANPPSPPCFRELNSRLVWEALQGVMESS